MLEDLSHALARLGRALDVLDGTDPLLDFLALLEWYVSNDRRGLVVCG